MTSNLPDSHAPSWRQTLHTSIALIGSILFVSACFWFSTGSNELQMRKARTELSGVTTPAAFTQAFDHLVHCPDTHACALGTTLAARLKTFWIAAESTGAIRFAPDGLKL